MNILGIDPGRAKTGLAVVDERGAIVWRAIVPTPQLKDALQEALQQPIARIALGHSTGSQAAAAVLQDVLETLKRPIPLQIVDERDSTTQARALYFQTLPPRGWRALLPRGLLTPPVPVDDFAAAILARRALSGSA